MLSMQQLVVGIFRNRTHIEQAINELRQIGFDDRHIRFAKHGMTIDGMRKKIKSLFGEQISPDEIYHDLVNIGMPPEDARYYQSEFEAGCSIVVIHRSGVPLVATSILIRNGAHTVNEHFAQFTDSDQSTNKSTRTSTPFFLQGLTRLTQIVNRYLSVDQPTGIQEPSNENTNAKPSTTKERIAPFTNNGQSNDIQETGKNLINA